ncbi:hypothetical protein ABLE91_19360 [Aquabacter sp. CN5-332]|uniref:hypothetical protein n=1 Tax=Aquabacter sp. CN5-332 TaxID=3156608 RepID=UPI0032B5B8EB
MRTGTWAALGCAAALAAGGAWPASAQEGMPQTRTMSCAQVQSLMARAGALLLATGPTTYDRYVKDVAFCPGGDVTKPQWVPTQNGACFVGGICWNPSTDSGNR